MSNRDDRTRSESVSSASDVDSDVARGSQGPRPHDHTRGDADGAAHADLGRPAPALGPAAGADCPETGAEGMVPAITQVTVRVPATSANLGVGFDCLGVALDLTAAFVFEPADELAIVGCDERHVGPHNLVWTSYLAACGELGVSSAPLRIREGSPIPPSGGLGSSSTCVVAGVVAAQALAGLPVDDAFTLDLATRIEGHPDNVAPAYLGGLVSSFTEDGRCHSTRWDVGENLRFVCLAPPYRVLTAKARAALPLEVPMSTVAWQVGRCVAMVRALEEGDPARIAACCHDKVHEPFRAPLIRDYARLKARALEAGACAFLISGSGATMLAIADGDVTARRVAAAAQEAMPELWVRMLRVDPRGTTVEVKRSP